MITDNQAMKLMKYLQEKRTLEVAAAKFGINEKTARKYCDLGYRSKALQGLGIQPH